MLHSPVSSVHFHIFVYYLIEVVLWHCFDELQILKKILRPTATTSALNPSLSIARAGTLSDQHATVCPRVVLLSGPAIQTGEYTFRFDPDYFGHDPKRLWTVITLSIEADDDSR